MRRINTYINTFHQYSFVNEISLPTFISPSNGSAVSSIDHVWHNLNVPRYSYVVSPALSDHYAVCIIFKINYDSPPKTTRFRDFSDVNSEGFAENIDVEFLLCSPPVSNPNEYAEYVVNFMKSLMNNFFPIKLKTITQRRLHSPWITTRIMKCIRKKHRWFRLLRNSLIG